MWPRPKCFVDMSAGAITGRIVLDSSSKRELFTDSDQMARPKDLAMASFDTSDTADVVQSLSDQDCWELLKQERLGRLVVSVCDRIDILRKTSRFSSTR